MSAFVFKGKDEGRVIRLCWVMCGILVALDQATKALAENCAQLVAGKPIVIIPGLFNLVLINNTGAAWGILSGRNMILLIISCAVLALMLFFMKAITEGWPERYFGLFSVLSGIIGNSIDRASRKSVVDFLDFYVTSHHWPAFNVADSAICVGVFILVLSFMLRPTALSDGGLVQPRLGK